MPTFAPKKTQRQRFLLANLPCAKEIEEENGISRKTGTRARERVIGFQNITLAHALSKPLLVVGDPGSGKSTLLRWLAVTFAQGRQREADRIGPEAEIDRFPIFIELGHLPERYLQDERGEAPNWFTLVPDLISQQQDFYGTPVALIQQALNAEHCLLLFDGLDEVANRQARLRLARSLADFQRLAPGNQIVISSRPTGLSESETALRPVFQHCEIQPFTPEDLQRFLHSWYKMDQTLSPAQQVQAATVLYQHILSTPDTRRLVTTPLLATILLLLWLKEEKLPERSVSLYERCCRVLVEQWENAHDIRYQSISDQFRWEQHLYVLAAVAYFMHQQEQRLAASEEDLIPVVERCLMETRICPDKTTAKWKAAHFLELLALRSALLQYRGTEQGMKWYGFPHLAFQEYLAARFIADQHNCIDLTMEHLHESWWQEVHLLTIGYLGANSQYTLRVSALLQTIMQRYRPPWWPLRSSRIWLLRLIGFWVPEAQLERRLAWILRRDEMLALRATVECAPDSFSSKIQTDLIKRTKRLVRTMFIDQGRRLLLYNWLTANGPHFPSWIREAIIVVLLELLHNPDWDVRRKAVKILGIIRERSEIVTQNLLDALHDSSVIVRRNAAESLGMVGEKSEIVVQELLKILDDPNWIVRRNAAESLRKLEEGGKITWQGLAKVQYDFVEGERWNALPSTVNRGVEYDVTVQDLLSMLNESSSYRRQWAIENLGLVKITTPKQLHNVLVALNRCMHDWDDSMRSIAFQSVYDLLDGRAFPDSGGSVAKKRTSFEGR